MIFRGYVSFREGMCYVFDFGGKPGQKSNPFGLMVRIGWWQEFSTGMWFRSDECHNFPLVVKFHKCQSQGYCSCRFILMYRNPPKKWVGYCIQPQGDFFNEKNLKFNIGTKTMWWFQIFFMFTPTSGRFPFWLIFFRWVVQPPPRKFMTLFLQRWPGSRGSLTAGPYPYLHGNFHHRNRSRWTVKRSFIGLSWTYGNWFGKPKKTSYHLGVSLNGGTPKWMVYNGKPF